MNFMDNYSLKKLGDPNSFHENIDISIYPNKYYISTLKRMKLIRRAEEILGENVENGIIKCPCHLSIGQEAIPVGISKFLNSNDYVFGNHRSHGHYLAMNDDAHSLFAETLGKVTGSAKGMGGSMHVIAKEHGFHGSVPIVSATIPVSVGAALSAKLKGNGSIAVSYFGDGATEEGTFHESLNLASFYNLPVIFVCENNLFSSHMHINERQPFDSVSRFAEVNKIPFSVIDGNDINEVMKTAESAIKSMKEKAGPFFIEAITYRWRGHVGHDENVDVGLRRKEDLNIWKKRDPISRLENSLVENRILSEKEIHSIDKEIDNKVISDWNRADADPFPDLNQLEETVYYNS